MSVASFSFEKASSCTVLHRVGTIKSHKRWGMSDRPIVGPGSEKDKSLFELVVPECVAVSRSPY